jgi:RHS repeat-associated protein
MLVVQERWFDPLSTSGLPQRTITYTRGPDLSHTLQGAGGIGGLLARTDSGSLILGSVPSTAYYHCDANGNITCLINSSQLAVARYEYDPYGNTISASGSLADGNLYRFSSKEIHLHSTVYYYGYRFFAPALQRWGNRDPVQEADGLNLFTFLRSEPIGDTDFLGLSSSSGIVRFPYPDGPGDNCYTYACNRPFGPTTPGSAQGPWSCEKVVAGLLSDHPEANTPMGCDHSCPPGMHRISAFASPQDFHFHRQDSDGGVSHKRGNTHPNRFPFDFDSDPWYDDFCGEFCVYD